LSIEDKNRINNLNVLTDRQKDIRYTLVIENSQIKICDRRKAI